MPRNPAQRPARQDRSRESLRKMLDAAEIVLATHGLQGATLSRIAARAGVSPANVYRRFRDKDALMQAVFLRLSQRSSAEVKNQFDPEKVPPIGLVQFSRNVIEGMIRGYRADARLSRVAVEYSELHWEVGFVRKARASEAQSFRRMVDTFLIWRDQIKNPDPERAIRFAFLMVSFALRELILFDRSHIFAAILPLSDDLLKQELPRLFLRYLGVAGPEARRRPAVTQPRV